MTAPRFEDIEGVRKTLQGLVESGDMDAAKDLLQELHPSDVADLVESLDSEKVRVGLMEVLPIALSMVVLAALVPLCAYPILKYVGKFNQADSGAIAAHYGSVSAVTFHCSSSNRSLSSSKVASCMGRPRASATRRVETTQPARETAAPR